MPTQSGEDLFCELMDLVERTRRTVEHRHNPVNVPVMKPTG
jgi:hypothetical protein